MKRRTKLFRLFCFVILGIVGGGAVIGGASSEVKALNYRELQRVDFTFNPTLNLALSSDSLVIPDLTLGNSGDSNVINIATGTNVITGMQLTATVGSSATGYNNTNLVNGSNVFAALGSTVGSLSNFGNNTWGYSYCSGSCDTATNWVSGDSGSTTSGYAGLPLYTDTGVKLVNTTTTTDTDVKFKIGAKASMSQAAGTYTNTINFEAVAKVEPISYVVSYIDGSGQSQDMPDATEPASTTQDIEVTLSDVVPTRSDGYTFTGWCTVSTSGNFCTGNYYRPGEKYPISNIGEDVNIELYAMWRGPLIYDLVAGMVKKTGTPAVPVMQTAAELRAVIVDPTEENQISSNSGVYKYNGDNIVSGGFGAASDASNDYDIYYYRGILDSYGHTGTYGSDGLADAYPNYVKLVNKNGDGYTCWRIVRTTGSGGVKMIYNGKWTGSTCANNTTAAQVATSAFNGTSSTYQQIVRVGYTYNSTYATNTAQTAKINVVLGSDSDASVNNAPSTIKSYIEDTWFSSDNGIGAYESVLESSAGYCNDRTVYNNTSPYTQQDESATDVVTYGTSDITYYRFGANVRNMISNGTRKLTLGCPRDVVDLYTTSSASNGNKQLNEPVALLTADEVALAGSGYGSTYSSNYSSNSYLCSGSNFWLLSPGIRASNGIVHGFLLYSNGNLTYGNVSNSFGVRPAISLVHGTSISSGSGTATDPWVIYAQQ